MTAPQSATRPPSASRQPGLWQRRIETFSQIWSLLRPYHSRIALIALAGSVSVLFETATLALLVPLASAIGSSARVVSIEMGPISGTLPTSGLLPLLIATSLGKAAFALIRSRQDAALLARYEREQRERATMAFSNASWARQSLDSSSDLYHLVLNVVTRSQGALKAVTGSVGAATGLGIMLLVALSVGGALALGLTVAIGLLGTLLVPVLKRSRAHSRHMLTIARRISGEIEEAVTTARDRRIYRVEQRSLVSLRTSLAEYEKHRRGSWFLAEANVSLFESGGILLVIGSLGLLQWLEPSGLESYAVMALLMARGLVYGRQLNSMLQAIGDASPFTRNLEQVIADYAANEPSAGTVKINRIETLELNDCSYSYSSGDPVLSSISLELTLGDTLALVGPSGSGKSTMAELVLGLRVPKSGTYRVNGIDSQDIDPSSWFSRLAYVPQSPRLISGTVSENIRFFRAGVSDADCQRAARLANIHEEIMAMPRGYDQRVGSGAQGLSGGQVQRLCVARALVGSPDLLVLDEPTSALDAESEAAIARTLRRVAGTTILVVIAHRWSTIAMCETLGIVRSGRLEAVGPREVLREHAQFVTEAETTTEMC